MWFVSGPSAQRWMVIDDLVSTDCTFRTRLGLLADESRIVPHQDAARTYHLGRLTSEKRLSWKPCFAGSYQEEPMASRLPSACSGRNWWATGGLTASGNRQGLMSFHVAFAPGKVSTGSKQAIEPGRDSDKEVRPALKDRSREGLEALAACLARGSRCRITEHARSMKVLRRHAAAARSPAPWSS